MWDEKTGVYKMAGTDANDNSDYPIKTLSIPKMGVVWRYKFLRQ